MIDMWWHLIILGGSDTEKFSFEHLTFCSVAKTCSGLRNFDSQGV